MFQDMIEQNNEMIVIMLQKELLAQVHQNIGTIVSKTFMLKKGIWPINGYISYN